MADNTNNKEFWNNYVTYWENRVKETNDGTAVKDRTSDDFILETYFERLKVKETDAFLDFGCGSGRLYPIYKKICKDDNYKGIDVSGVCLQHAERNYEGLEVDSNLKEFDGVHIPFDDNSFDKVMCFGVFDACNQEIIIRELMRVLKAGGYLLITGKNNNYFKDDEAAVVAEINARKKEHPNYFTDVHSLTKQLQEHGVKMVETYYFPRRCDGALDKAVSKMPDVFYQWGYLIEKTEGYKDYKYQKFSDKYSLISINQD